MLVLLRYVLIAGAIFLWIYCVLDVVRTPPENVRNLHKLVWLAFVVLVPQIGSLAWLLLGRPDPIGARFRGSLWGPPSDAAIAPDDSPEYLASLDEEIKRRRRANRRRPAPPDIDPEVVDDEIQRLEKEFGGEDPEGEPKP